MDRLLQRIGLQYHVKVKARGSDVGGGEDEEETRPPTVSSLQCVSVSACDRSPVGADARLQWCDLLSSFPTDVVCVTTSPADSDDVYSCAVSSEGRLDAKVRTGQLATDEKCDDAARVKRRPYRGLRERIRHNCHYLELHRMEFRPGAIRRRFCGGKKHDNELYRSNSFKFERFERSEDSGTLQNQVSLCEEYSIPVDFVNKPRPHSFGANLVNWTTPSPSGESVEIVAAYCDPRDSKAYLEPGEEASGKLYTSPDRDYSQPYTDNSWGPRSSDDSEDGVYEDVGLPQDSPLDAINKCVTVIRVNESADEYEEELGQTFQDEPVKAPVRRNPSPYYYGDLFRAEIGLDRETSLGSFHFLTSGEETDSVKHAARLLGELKVIQASPKAKGYRKSSSVDTPAAEVTQPKKATRVYVHDQGYRKSVSLDSPTPTCESPVRVVVKQRSLTDGPPLAPLVDDACSSGERAESLLAACLQEWDSHMPPLRGLRGPGLPSSCACAGNREDADDSALEAQARVKRPNADYDLAEEDVEEADEMSGRRRHLYETAFDCKVSRSDDDLDDDDKVTNHPALHGTPEGRVPCTGSSQELGAGASKERRLITLVRGKLVKERPKSNPLRLKTDSSSSSTILSRGLDDLDLEGDRKKPATASPLRGFTSSPPSTAPLPAKFHGKDELVINSIKSAPNLPMSSPGHPRLKDLRLPVKSLRAREESKQDILEFKGRPRSFVSTEVGDELKMRPRSMFQESDLAVKDRSGIVAGDGKVLEIKGRPTIDFSRSKMLGKETDNILEIKGRPRKGGVRLNFSSTESMATSSSGGSLESIRSSTSEGNRSTSSSESQHSTSLSSHSSDSLGSVGSTTINLIRHFHHQSKGHTGLAGKSGSRMFAHHSNKLNILSPISDKSSIEPASETSDNNRNNNSQKASPEEGEIVPSPSKPPEPAWMETGLKVKRRTPQNKNLLSLSVLQSSSSGEAEVQGSDSGISIDSRSTTKNKGYSGSGFSFLKLGTTSNAPSNVQSDQQADFSDLPFDMPKLRRRRLLQQDTCTSGSVTSVELPFDMPKLRRHAKADATCTSGSATSIDLQDLPFDMPKLRRRLRCGPQQTTPSFGADLIHPAGIPIRPSLTLNLDQGSKAPPKQLFGLSLNIAAPTIGDDAVDTSLPLDRQGWYHGTITRVEAENVLRLLKEGSYLVRNSESTRQDFSLSLKSAKGFMHMRIQANQETGKYILGQFSNPFDNIPDMIRHYSVNRLPIRGAEHMCLLHPVIEQLL